MRYQTQGMSLLRIDGSSILKQGHRSPDPDVTRHQMRESRRGWQTGADIVEGKRCIACRDTHIECE